jgi:hypothetical protein
MNARDRKIGGQLTANGASLSFKTSVDALSAKLNLEATELRLEQLELKRKSDILQVQGKNRPVPRAQLFRRAQRHDRQFGGIFVDLPGPRRKQYQTNAGQY